MPAFHSLQEEFEGRAKFLSVYVQEAHAQNEWPISSSRANGGRGVVAIDQPQSLKERCAVATRFCDDFHFKLPMMVDSMHNDFDRAYAPWPIRMYVLHRGKVTFIAHPELGRFDATLLRVALLEQCK